MNWLFIITGVTIVAILILFFFNSYLKKNLIESWPQYLINIVFVLIGATIAIWGVNWAFKKETARIIQNQQEYFKRSYYAIMIENSDSIVLAKRLKSGITNNTFNTDRFTCSTSESVLSNPLLYKYSGNEYIILLSTYAQKVQSTNQVLAHYYSLFVRNGQIEDRHIEIVKKKLDSLLYHTLLLQLQSQVYSWAYGDFKVYVPPNQKQILSYLTDRNKYTASDIEHAITAASAKKTYYSKFLEKDMSEFWRDFKSWQTQHDKKEGSKIGAGPK